MSRSDFRGFDDIRKAADLGYAPAQFTLGYLLETGTYTGGGLSDAVTWYRKAAEQGDRLAQWNLGRCYYTGIGVATDLDKAETWLKQAADQGDPFGQYLLGRVKQDRSSYEQAARFFDESAHQGLPQAQVRLARMFKEGRAPGGVNKYRAYVWFLVAQAAGDSTVANDISELEGQLGSTLVEKRRPKPMISANKRLGQRSPEAAPDGKENWTRFLSLRQSQFSSFAIEFPGGTGLSTVHSAVCFVRASGASYWYAPAHGDSASSSCRPDAEGVSGADFCPHHCSCGRRHVFGRPMVSAHQHSHRIVGSGRPSALE